MSNWYYADILGSLQYGEDIEPLASKIRDFSLGVRRHVEAEITAETPEDELHAAVVDLVDNDSDLAEYTAVAGDNGTSDLIQYIIEQELSDSPGELMATANQRLSHLEAVYGTHVKTFGAKCDGDHDDTDAWLEGIAEISESGGTLVFDGVSIVTDNLEIPDDSYMSIKGSGFATLKAGAAITGPLLRAESVIGGYGSRYGRMQDFIIDGNDLAQEGLRFQVVDRQFDNITIIKCTSKGLYNAGSQNCVLNSVKCYDNGTTGSRDGNYVMDLGARLNTHVGMQCSATYLGTANRGVCNLRICQSAASDIAGGEPPSYNSFVCSQFERHVATSWIGSVVQTAGLNNHFFGGSMQCTGNPCLVINSADGYNSGYMTIHGTGFSGNTLIARVYSSMAARPALVIQGGSVAETMTTLFEISDNSEVEINGTMFTGGSTLAANYGGGTKTIAGLVTRRMLSLPTTPNSTTGIPASHPFMAPIAYDAALQAIAAYQGSWRDANLG